jgi:glycosyltransferase involved in cell wall biosynthesis
MSNILFLIPSLAGGGEERVVLTLAQGFAERGWNVTIGCATAQGPLRAHVPESVELIDMHSPRVLRALPSLVRILRAHPDSIVFAGMNHMCVVTLLAARVLTRHAGPVIVHEAARLDAGRDHESRFKWRILLAFMRWLYPLADSVVTSSESVRAELEASISGLETLNTLIPIPANLTLAAERGAHPATHPWLSANRERPVILGVGRLSPEKGFDLLVAALRHLHDAGGRQRLLVAGGGDEAPALKAQAERLGLSEDIDFLGHVDNPWSLMAAADLLVVPSRAEGFCLALVEAMSLGCQVVSTRFGSSALDILDNGRLGELAPTDEPAALAQAISRSFAAPRPQTELRAAARRFDAATIVADYITLATSLREAGADTSRRRRNQTAMKTWTSTEVRSQDQ